MADWTTRNIPVQTPYQHAQDSVQRIGNTQVNTDLIQSDWIEIGSPTVSRYAFRFY
jgi:hypothetical protein